MFNIEVYSSEANRWYLWLDNVLPSDLDAECKRALKIYPKYRVVSSKP